MMLGKNTNYITQQEHPDLAGSGTELMINSGPLGSYEPDASIQPFITHVSYEEAREIFKLAFCGGDSKPALITLSNGVGPYGSCALGSVANSENPSEIADRIVLRRNHVGTLPENLSALARNMIQLKLYHDGFGNPSRPGRVDSEFCKRMKAVGLPTYVIDKRDGRKIYGKPGESVHHEIEPGGLFDRVCTALISRQNPVLFLDRAFGDSEEDEKAARVREKKADSKTRFVCGKIREEALDDPTKQASEHYKLKTWGHRKTNIRCGFCFTAMTPG